MTEELRPVLSLQRTLNVLLLVYGCCILTTFLAGATLVAHVDPFSECLLYSYTQGDNLFYGAEAICETIGYLFLACIIGSTVMFYLTFKHRKALMVHNKGGHFIKPDVLINKLSGKFITMHVVGALFVSILTSALTAGYAEACDNLNSVVSSTLLSKLNKDDDLQRGERLDERFVHDNQFWRYTGQINNAFGSEIYSIRISCRTIFTDPDIHQRLHDTHVKKYSSYFGYWYKQDLYTYDPQAQAVLTNALVEASLAGGWLSMFLLLGSLVFMIVQRYYIKKSKREFDRVSLHSAFEGSMRKDHESMISGYNSNFNRGGLRGSDTTLKSTKSRREMDELAFAVHGLAPSNGLAGLNTTLNGPQSIRYDYNPVDMYPDQYTPRAGRAYINPRNPETTLIEREHVETEIM